MTMTTYRVTILQSVMDLAPDPVTGLPRYMRTIISNVPQPSLEAGLRDRVLRISSNPNNDPLWALQFPYDNAIWVDAIPMSLVTPPALTASKSEPGVTFTLEHTTDASPPVHK